MAAVRIYGIPRVAETREIFHFNGGAGSLPIRFTGGIPDPKYNIPATYVTDNEFEQIVIEHDILFGRRVFRYNEKGQIIASTPVDPVAGLEAKTPAKGKNKGITATVDQSKTYENVTTLGEATEALLELGAKADELNGQDAVISAMVRYKVSFPNLKL